ncbi:MAG: 2-oxo acid dehydrogenase subunit E2, partial [Limnochordales bacterium]
SNLGPLGADGFTAMVNPPQAAILAVGRASERAVVRDGAVAVRTMMSLTVTADHRVVDGAAATAFLLEVARRLQTASDWILA